MKNYFIPALLISTVISTSAFAACVTPLSCATLGYTASSCPNGGLRCPFDPTKWYCSGCGADYKYACNSTNDAGGFGTLCNGKYSSCKCKAGYEWKEGSCQKINIITIDAPCCDSVNCSSTPQSYNFCKSNYGFEDCAPMQEACKSSGGKPRAGCQADYGSTYIYNGRIQYGSYSIATCYFE